MCSHRYNSGPAWASCQIRTIAGAHAPWMPGTFSPPPRVSDPSMHHGTCDTHVQWCMSGSLTRGFLWCRRQGKTFPPIPAHAQPTILLIWEEAHWQRYLPNINQTSHSPQHYPVPQPNGWHKVLTPIARSMGPTRDLPGADRWALSWPHEPCYLGRYSEKTQCAMHIWQYKIHKCQVSLHFSLHKVYSYYDPSQYSHKYSQYILHISTLKVRYAVWSMFYLINSLRLRQNGHNFTNDEMHFLERKCTNFD